ncbi:hypothetical protein GFB49_11700 [Epibacterium sp. SM1979]|uniref:Uncharacterized protein n=1 Tax=Tritonibacter litoralis TaxID=2662264 RepID=A0A843YDX9_9RHOB|nr:hypothetical protein [Tritonibacter litoralis]MQQ09121.1 hypothetical protein [Tritonibacter litoralis]
MNDEEHELDYNLKPPEPFDRAIANLNLRGISNTSSEGLDLEITASFGNDYIDIPLSDGGILEARCNIFEALIVAKPYNCHFTDKNSTERDGGYQIVQKFHGERSSSQMVQRNSSVGGEVSGGKYGASASASHTRTKNKETGTSDKHTITGEKQFRQVQYGLDQIRIFPNPDKAALVGNLVDHSQCFRVLPIDSSKPFGVLVQLLVRRNWLLLSDPKPISLSEQLTSFLDRALKGNDPIDRFHKEAFQVLLQHLVSTGLQAVGESTYATFAARAIRAIPVSGNDLEHRHIDLHPRSLELPVRDIEAVLSEDPVAVRRVLLEHGVDEANIPGLPRRFAFLPTGVLLEDLEQPVELLELMRSWTDRYDRSDFDILTSIDSNSPIRPWDKVIVPAGHESFSTGRMRVKRIREVDYTGIRALIEKTAVSFQYIRKSRKYPSKNFDYVEGEFVQITDDRQTGISESLNAN